MARRLLLVAAFLLSFPAVAQAGVTSVEIRELSLGEARTLAGASPQAPFQLLGVHWRGPGVVRVRTRSTSGGWTAWRLVREGEARGRPGWRIGAPLWVGSAVALEVRTAGRVTRARAVTVRSPVSRLPVRTAAAAGMPQVVARGAWLADESIVKGTPTYAPALQMAHVHHTAGTNGYTRAQAPAVVRAIQAYHVKGNGWNDIGYNALVDRFGTVYEGRAGGLDRNVVGAHARGFNTGSFGIALMGDFRTAEPSQAAVDALVRTLAWRLDAAHVDPLATFNGISGGNERFGPGIPVFLRAISGHRDTGHTTCPGERLHARLGEIARRVASLGLPKLYAPAAAADEGGGIRFRARVSSALPWSVTVTDPAGNELGRGEGTGAAVDWVWLPPGPLPAGVRWRIEAPGATAAEGTIGTLAPVALQIGSATASPATITPNGDGQADTATVAFTLNADANVTVTVVDAAGATVAQVEPRRWRRAGERTVTVGGGSLGDGAYAVRISARATGGREASIDVPLVVSRLLGRVSVSAAALTPNGDGRDDTVRIVVPVTAPGAVMVRILRDGKWVATPFSGAVEPGEHPVSWDGSKRLGKASDGAYTVSVEITDGAVTARTELPLLVDGTAPRLRLVSASPPRLRVSEPATVTLRVNGARRVLRVPAAGIVRIPRIERVRTLVGTAVDAAGNRTVLRLGSGTFGDRPRE